VILKEANLTRDTEVLGKMSPYCIVSVSDFSAKKSKTIDFAGKKPNFKSESFQFNMKKNDSTNINFHLFDFEKYTEDDDVCQGNFDYK
jgi:hypothetical protein